MTDIATTATPPKNPVKVNSQPCDHCSCGPNHLGVRVVENSANKPRIVNCHATGAICFGIYERHKEQIEASFPIEIVDCSAVIAKTQPLFKTPRIVFDGETMSYADKVGEAKQRAADHESVEALHRDERNALMAQAAIEVFAEIRRQALDSHLTVTSERAPQNGSARFGFTFDDRENEISYDLTGSVDYANNLEEVDRRYLRIELPTRARHTSDDSRLGKLIVGVFYFLEDGSLSIDLCTALVAAANHLLAK